MIQFSNVSKSYADKRIIDSLSFSFPAGEITALTGVSGGGKTTLLRLIAGLERPESGEISGLGERTVSFLYQESRLFPWLSVRENILCVTDGKTEAQSTADALLEQLDLHGTGDMYPSALSGGMQRRVALARTLAYDGDIVLLDEPFTGLDPATKATAIRAIAAWCRGKTTILVTHDLCDAYALTTHVFHLSQGILTPIEKSED